MPTYTVQAVIHRPTYVIMTIEAADRNAAWESAENQLADNVGAYRLDIPDLESESEETYDGSEVLSVEEVEEDE